MALIAVAVVVGAALIVAAWVVVSRARQVEATARHTAQARRRLQLLQLLAPGIAAAAEDPRALLTWQPLASTARAMFPDDFVELDRAAGTTFPFSRDQIEAAHARWSSDWLTWERSHDAEYKVKSAAAEEELRASPESAVLRARLEAEPRSTHA